MALLLPKIRANLNNRDRNGWIELTREPSLGDLEEHPVLTEGDEVVLIADDVEVHAILHRQDGTWRGELLWDTWVSDDSDP